MKRLAEYTPAELATLTNEDMDKLVRIEQAAAGVPLPCPLPALERPAITPDVLTYTLGKYLEFTDRQAAADVLAYALGTGKVVAVTYRTVGDGYVQTAQAPEPWNLGIDTHECYNPDTLARCMATITDQVNSAAKREKLASQEAALDARRKAVADGVYKAVDAARELAQQAAADLATFTGMVEDADGDTAQATEWMIASHGAARADRAAQEYLRTNTVAESLAERVVRAAQEAGKTMTTGSGDVSPSRW